MMPTLLVFGSAAFEVVSLHIMGILSNFYRSVSSHDLPLFYNTLWTSIIVVSIVAALKSCVAFVADACALQWRSCLVSYIHRIYSQGSEYSGIDNCTVGRLDFVDQRITQDVDRLTTQGAKLFAATAVIPGVIIFYAVYLAVLFGPLAPLLCLLYFLVGSAVSYVIARGIAGTVYKQERLEGEFRATHCRAQLYTQEIFLLGGEPAESLLMTRDFDELAKNTSVLIRYRLWLSMFANWFAYTGSIGKIATSCLQ